MRLKGLVPPQQTTDNVSILRFDRLSDEGLNVAERVLRGILEETRSKAQALEGEVQR